jgi:hypothetical protein
MRTSHWLRTLEWVPVVLLTAIIAAPEAAALPAGSDSAAIEAQLRQIVSSIEEEQAKNGPYSPQLIDLFRELTSLYEAGGDHALETAAIQRTLQLVRVTYGLHALEQTPVIWRLIEDEERKGNPAAAWALEQELLDLARRNPDDVRTVRILHQIGDRRMDVLGRYDEGKEFPPQVILGCYYYVERIPIDAYAAKNCNAGNKTDVIRNLLHEAQNDYAEAINILQRHELYSSDELRELEMNLVRSSYLYGNPATGAYSLRRLAAYSIATSQPRPNQIDALVQYADWNLIFGTPVPGAAGKDVRDALELYKNIYRQIQSEGVDEAVIDQIFAPQRPVTLPAFMPDPLASPGTRASTRFIDVAFDVTKFGEAKRVEILDTTRLVTKEAKQRLVQLIKRSTFRPRIVDGELVDASRVTLRYYLADLTPPPADIPRQ